MNGDSTGFFTRLKQRKLVQWALAYIAAAFALIQVIDVVADSYDWPHVVMHLVFGALALGFVVVLVLAWYHGERGAQRVSGPELLLIALALAIGGGLLWHFGRGGSSAGPAKVATTTQAGASAIATRSLDEAPRNPGSATPDSTAKAASSGLRGGVAAQPIPAKSIAVLPFENLSDDKKNEYFVAGMQDLILTKLADIGDLKVISRTSTEKYKSHPESVKEIAQQLGVATILEGSVQRSGDRVLIDVQLIDANTDNHVWAKSYTRTLHDLFGVEGEVAESIAKTRDAKLTTAEAARVARVPTTNGAALDAYLRGEYHMAAFSQGEVKSEVADAVREYSQAVKLDPDFALAWAHLAHAQVFLRGMTVGDPALSAQLKADAKASVARSLTLQPDLADAYMAQGIYDLFAGHEPKAALQTFEKARALQPQTALAWGFIGYTLFALGDDEGAVRAYQQAQVLDPKRPPVQLAGGAQYLHRFAQAEALYKRALALAPDSWVTLDSLASLYAYFGDLPELGQLIEDASPAIKANPNFVDTVGMYLTYRRDWPGARKLYATAKEPENLRAAFYPIEVLRGDVDWYAGDRAAARAQYQRALPLLQAQLQQNPKLPRWHAELGWVYARLGRDDEALQQGRLALGAGDPSSGVVRHSPHGALALARIQAQVGKTTEAIAVLDQLLASPHGTLVSVPLLKMDPTWDPIRHDPRFQALLKKYADAAPAAASGTIVE
jgi:TolB-like protein/tetratricopeptide (TPR) repeat protein